MPELLWKAYIDFEISIGEFEKARAIYERLLNCTKHLKVWISYAKFEASAAEDKLKEDEHELKKKECIQRARCVFERALELKVERAMLLGEWLEVEISFGDVAIVDFVRAKLPKKLKRRRLIQAEDGKGGYEEYMDYLFPEETEAMIHKFLNAAYKWKKPKIFQS